MLLFLGLKLGSRAVYSNDPLAEMPITGGPARRTRSHHAAATVCLLLMGLTSCSYDHPPLITEFAYIDFAAKPDGIPPDALDTGQPVDFTLQNVGNRTPAIKNGALVRGTLPPWTDEENFANYYQAELNGDCRAFGARWTVDSSDGSTTEGFVTFATWAGTYEPPGTAVPRTPGHIGINTVTGEWKWWVSDGMGLGADHLKVIKSGFFVAPPSDGVAVWESAVYLSPDLGSAYLVLPGEEVSTGSRYVTLTDAEIAATLSTLGLPGTTLAATSAGSNIVMIEHYANRGTASTARFPRFLSMWGQAVRRGESDEVGHA